MKALSRRAALIRALQVSAATGLPFSFTASGADAVAPWPTVTPTPVKAAGYGTDPDLIHPAPGPWPRTLKPRQKTTLQILADLIIPRDGATPSASELGAVDVMDEWVSAPYPAQQAHRQLLLAGLEWLDNYSPQRFSELAHARQLAVVDLLAYPERNRNPGLNLPIEFFSLVRQLTVGAFYTSPEGSRELGYAGNVPITGDYPGPTAEALAHLDTQLAKLGLTPAIRTSANGKPQPVQTRRTEPDEQN